MTTTQLFWKVCFIINVNTSFSTLKQEYKGSFAFGFPLLVFYKTAELGGYMGARQADAEAWSKK